MTVLPTRLRGALDRLGCSPAEVVALVVLALGAVAVVGVLWWVTPVSDPASADPGRVPVDAPANALDGFTPPAEPTPSPTVPQAVVVHVSGQVAEPGVLRLDGGARAADAVHAAGGATDHAVLDHVNLARTLVDGEQLFIPGPDDPVPPPTGPDGAGQGPAGAALRPDGLLDLNLATQPDLEELPGVGPVLAERIITHRDEAGGFSSVGDLRDVSGIGEVRFQELSALVDV